ncbi:hypothetical protein [Absidia glauca]|uniref:Uncharacterized protein n=1 Tax=Absidia glauca TaxID=4829 RepID=A0A163J4V6_ABSGL|nr:hypothetical protein [Absidia glauca]
MNVDQPSPSLINTQSNTQTSRRNSPFPSKLVFTGQRATKRPRVSAAPSPAQHPASLLPPQPPLQQKTEVETKQEREQKQLAFQQAVNAKVADQLAIVRHDIEQHRQMQRQQDVTAFSQVLALVKFVKDHLDRSGIVPQEPLEIHTIVANGLRPTRLQTDTDRTLNVLANDISACMAQIYTHGVKATLSQIFFVLRGLIQLCIQDQRHRTFIRAVDLIYTLSKYYSEYITTYLQQEISGAGDQSILHLLTKGLQLVPLANTNEGPSKHAFISGLPKNATESYSNCKAFLEGIDFSTSDKFELLTGVSSMETQETINMVLELLSGVCNDESKPAGMPNRFLFLFDQKGFMDLISSLKPLTIVREALHLIHAVILTESTEWLYNKKHRLLLETIASFAKIPRLSRAMELPWYRLKSEFLQIFGRILDFDPVPLSQKETLTWALYPSIYILNNECLRIEDSYKPPFESPPEIESNHLIVESIVLMHKSLDVYPMLLAHEDAAIAVYVQVIASLNRFKQVTTSDYIKGLGYMSRYTVFGFQSPPTLMRYAMNMPLIAQCHKTDESNSSPGPGNESMNVRQQRILAAAYYQTDLYSYACKIDFWDGTTCMPRLFCGVSLPVTAFK